MYKLRFYNKERERQKFKPLALSLISTSILLNQSF